MSDLHLGSRLGRDVLRHDSALAALLAALDGIDRLVLLGDVVELAEGRASRAMATAEPVLRAIGARMGPEREIVVVPGNHDAALVRPWVKRRHAPLAVDEAIPADATPRLAEIVGWLGGPGAVRVHYPGFWLSERVWATHGHYLDRHLLPESAFGVWRGLLGRLPRDQGDVHEYEQHGGSRTRLEAAILRWLPRPPIALADDLANYLRAATMPRTGRPVGHHLAPITSRLLGAQMRRASMPALARVVHRLGVEADWVVFGHVHRLGPLATDDPAAWTGADGRLRIANTGAWVYEPLLVHRARPPHPYWPGGAILVEDGGDPQPIGLLDGLGPAQLR